MLATYLDGSLQDDSTSTDDLMAQENADDASYDTSSSDGSGGGGSFDSSGLLSTLATAAATGVNIARAVGLIPPTATTYPAGTIYTRDAATGKYRIATPTGSRFFKHYKEVSAVAATPPSFGLGAAMPRLLGAQARLLGGQARLLGSAMPKLLGALGATSVDAATYATDTSTPTSTWLVAGAAAVLLIGGAAYAMHKSKKADA